MTNTVGNVLQGVPVTTGGILIGTAAASLPTSASAATTGFTALGYAGEDGLTETADRTIDKIKAWGGNIVKVVQSEFSVSYQFTLYESLNANVLKAVHGSGNVTTTAATSAHGTLQAVQVSGDTMPKLPWIFDMLDGAVKIRIVVPLGQINTVGEITYNDGGVIGYPVTVEAFADSSGNNAYKYLDDGDLA
jgi:hypothetical protein